MEEGSPWTFNRVPLILKRLEIGEDPRSKKLTTMALWVQVYELKPGFFSDRVLQDCGQYMGKFLESCPSNFTRIWREYLRFRVLIDIEQPLKRRMKLSRKNEEPF